MSGQNLEPTMGRHSLEMQELWHAVETAKPGDLIQVQVETVRAALIRLDALADIPDPAAFMRAAERLAEASRKMKALMLSWRTGCATVRDCQEAETEFESALAAYDAATGKGGSDAK